MGERWRYFLIGPARWVGASIGLHVVLAALLIWANPFGDVQERPQTIAIEIVELAPPPEPEIEPETKPDINPPLVPRDPPPIPKPAASIKDASPPPATPKPPLSPLPETQIPQVTTPAIDAIVTAPTTPSTSAPSGVTFETRRALAGIFCNRMTDDERDAAGCPPTIKTPRHLQDAPTAQAWQPRQEMDDIYEAKLATTATKNLIERQLTPQGAPKTMPGGMSSIDNTVFMDRPSDTELDAATIANGGRPDWASAVEGAHGR